MAAQAGVWLQTEKVGSYKHWDMVKVPSVPTT